MATKDTGRFFVKKDTRNQITAKAKLLGISVDEYLRAELKLEVFKLYEEVKGNK